MSARSLALSLLGTIFAAILCLSAKTADAGNYLCHRDKATYWIKVDYETPDADLPCSVYRWVLSGEPELLWRATREQGFCEAKAEEVKQRLVAYGWLCLELDVEADDAAREPARPKPPSTTSRTPIM